MKSEIKSGVLVIYLEGNMTGTLVDDRLVELIKNSIKTGNKKVLFNLDGVKFTGSMGLSILLTTFAKLRNAGGEVALCNVPEQLKELLKITKLENVFNQQQDEVSALNFLTK